MAMNNHDTLYIVLISLIAIGVVGYIALVWWYHNKYKAK